MRVVLVFFLLLTTPAIAQTPSALSFEVASIKPAATLTPAMISEGKLHLGMNVDGARVDIGYMSLADLIPIAFSVKGYQVSGPDWMREQRWDILAKMPEGATKEQVPQMLQELLKERFQLKVRRENREHNIYALVVSKTGHKLKESPPETDPPAAPAEPQRGIAVGTGNNQIKINPSANGATIVTQQAGTMKMSMGEGGQMRMEMSKMSMASFAELLTRLSDRPVQDMTELKGNFQIALDLSMENLMSVARAQGMAVPQLGGRGGPGTVPEASDPSGSSILTSVQQLGLRLEPRKAPIEFVVVDHVEKTPTEN